MHTKDRSVMDALFKGPILVFGLFFLLHPITGQDTVYLSTYLEKYQDVSLSTAKALEEIENKNAKFLVIPPGKHHVYPDQAAQQYVKISNNINGMKRIAFNITGHSDLTIIGQGASMILHGTMMGMIIHQSDNITVKDLSFDWANPFYLQGIVTEVDADERSYVVGFNKEEDVEVLNNDLVINREDGQYFIGRCFWFDPDTRSPVYNLTKRMNRHWNPYKEKHYELTALDKNLIKVVNRIDSLPSPGTHFIAKWRNQPNVNRIAPGIHIQQSRHISFNNVAIHSAAGMGIIGEKSTDISLSNVRVVPTPTSDRIISTTADATHFVNCRGLIKVEDCLFEGMLDDGLNIHGNYATIGERINSTTLLAEIVHIQQKGFIFAQAGDQIAIINPASLLPVLDALTVKSFKQINDSYFEISFHESLDGISEGYGLENLTWNADLIFRKNTIRNNWARGVLFKTGGQILIEDNYISSSMSALRNWGEMNFFNESGRVNDVTIRGNTIVNVSRVGNGQPPIVIFPQNSTQEDDQYYNRNIRIIDNTIHTFDQPVLYARSVNGLEFSKNQIIVNEDYPPFFPGQPVLKIDQCKDIKMENNTYKSDVPATVISDEFSKRTLRLHQNENFVYSRNSQH